MARLVNVAAPVEPVVAVVVPPSVPPVGPDASGAVTTTPAWATGFPGASRSWITGCCRNAAPLCAAAEGWVVIPSRVAVPAPSVIAADEAGVSPDDEKVSVYWPASPEIARSVNPATPLALVVIVAVPVRDPPGDTAAVTETPATDTGLPLPSRSWTDGCCVNACPLRAELEGWVTMASWLGAPAPRTIDAETTAVSPGEVNRSV